MLILGRKPGDAILIDGGIRVVVLACDGGGVRLGIEAPASVGIVREEIARDIADENVRAGATPEHLSFLKGLETGREPGGPDAPAEPRADGSAAAADPDLDESS